MNVVVKVIGDRILFVPLDNKGNAISVNMLTTFEAKKIADSLYGAIEESEEDSN